MEMININIEGHPYQVEKGLTILEAARKCGFNMEFKKYFSAFVYIVASTYR